MKIPKIFEVSPPSVGVFFYGADAAQQRSSIKRHLRLPHVRHRQWKDSTFGHQTHEKMKGFSAPSPCPEKYIYLEP